MAQIKHTRDSLSNDSIKRGLKIISAQEIAQKAKNDSIRKAKELAAKEGRYLSVVATVCGTEGDPQNRTATSLQLAGAGAIVLPSNAQAARFVELITKNL